MLNMTDGELEDEDNKQMEVQATIEDYLKILSEDWSLTSVVSDLFLRMFICDSFILYWCTDNEQQREGKETLPKVRQIMSMNPKDCVWENDQGQNVLWYTIPTHTYNRIREVFSVKWRNQIEEKIKELLDEGIPMDWIEAVKYGSRMVVLDKRDGHNWIIYTKGPEQEGLSMPSMYKIFLFLEARRALKDGDFTTSYMMKHFIQHVTMGEASSSGSGMQNSRSTWATPNEITTMHEVMRQGVRSSRLVTNHTVEIKYVFPPKEMFDGSKYSKSESSILYWSHMIEVMLTGGGTTNSSGFLGVKSLSAHLAFSRDRVQEALTKFFRILRKEKSVQEMPDMYYITCSFDQNALKEPAQILKELTLFLDTNSMSPETALRETGRDSNRVLLEKRRAKIAQTKSGLYDPIIIRASQFSSGKIDSLLDNKGGRPANPETTQNEDTRTQPVVIK